MTYINIDAFEQARYTIFSNTRQRDGIGTLSEKSVHSVLKEYLAPNEQSKEVKIGGMYADLFFDDHIYEIQTRSFDKMKKKLSMFLELHPVTVVFPIIHHRHITLIDEKSGEIIRKRRSPKTGSIYDIFIELTRIKSFLHHEKLSFHILLIDALDYRSEPTKKRYRQKYDKIDLMPIGIVSELRLQTVEDFRALIPNIAQPFTSKQLSKELKIQLKTAQSMLNVLHHMKLIQRVGKCGNAYLYETTRSESVG